MWSDIKAPCIINNSFILPLHLSQETFMKCLRQTKYVSVIFSRSRLSCKKFVYPRTPCAEVSCLLPCRPLDGPKHRRDIRCDRVEYRNALLALDCSLMCLKLSFLIWTVCLMWPGFLDTNLLMDSVPRFILLCRELKNSCLVIFE